MFLARAAIALFLLTPLLTPQVITNAVASFTGAFKSADRKFLVIAVDNGETMRMYITGATKFIHDGKPAHAKDFHEDEKINVDASRDARMNLLAVRVENVKPAPKR